MAANPFDQFDAKPEANPFDQFDAPAASAAVPAPAEGQTLMPEPLLSGFLGTPDYKATAHQDKVMGRAVLKGVAGGASAIPALASDAVSNAGYGLQKLASKAGLVSAPDPKAYYGDDPQGGYFPALTAVNRSVDKGLDAAGLDRPETTGERFVSAGFEGAASGVGGFLASKAAQAGGGLASGLAAQPAQIAGASGAAAGVAGEGAAQAMETEAGRKLLPDWTPTAVGMATGALTGSALARAGSAAANARAGAAPTRDAIRAESDAAYERARSSGVEVRASSFEGLHDNIRRDLDAAGIFQDIKPGPGVASVLEPFENSRNGAPVPMTRMEGLRQNVNTMAKSPDPQTGRAAQIIKRRIDGFLNEDAVPADFVGGSGPNAGARAVADLRQGRALYQRQAKAGALEMAMEKAADRTAKTGYGGNGINVERQEIGNLITPGSTLARKTGLNAVETAQARDVVRGSTVGNIGRQIGKFAPEGPVSFLPTAAAVGTAGPAGLALPVAGYLGKGVARASQNKRIARLSDTIRRGYALPQVSGAPGVLPGAGAGFLATQDTKPRRGRYR